MGTVVNHYLVRGMTSGHCRQAVTNGIQELPGVLSVAIDPDLRGVIVASSGWLAREEVAGAVRSAGCEVDA
jgi:copper chaperone CopZ